LLARLPEVSDYASYTDWHAGAGDGRLRVFEGMPRESKTANDDDEPLAARSLEEMREAVRGVGGSLVVEHATPRLRHRFDSWGLTDSAAYLMKRVKEQLDPSDILSPGRYRLNAPR
jgi:FAD/FMN-containing dehydrogenase